MKIMRFSILLIFSLFLNLSSAQLNDKGLLWEIKNPKTGVKSYLFGTIHRNNQSILKFQDSIWCALKNAKTIVFEANVKTLTSDYLSAVSCSVYNLNALKRKEAKVSITPYGSDDGAPLFMDLMLHERAGNMHKKLFYLEKIEDQLALAKKLTFVYNSAATENEIQNAYETAQLNKLYKIIKGSLTDYSFNELILKRNVLMAMGLDSLLKKDTVFCAIGAGHLGGPDGVLALMKKKGYLIRAVDLGLSSCESELKPFKTKTITIDGTSSKFLLPGAPHITSEDSITNYLYCEVGQGNVYKLEVLKLINGINYDDLVNDFKDRVTKIGTVKPATFENGVEGFQAMTFNSEGFLVWQRIFKVENTAYIMTCWGGEKFMRSNRPSKYFNGFVK